MKHFQISYYKDAQLTQWPCPDLAGLHHRVVDLWDNCDNYHENIVLKDFIWLAGSDNTEHVYPVGGDHRAKDQGKNNNHFHTFEITLLCPVIFPAVWYVLWGCNIIMSLGRQNCSKFGSYLLKQMQSTHGDCSSKDAGHVFSSFSLFEDL